MTKGFVQISSLAAQLAGWVRDLRERSARLKPGAEKEALLDETEQTDVATRWVNSSDLKPPE